MVSNDEVNILKKLGTTYLLCFHFQGVLLLKILKFDCFLKSQDR